MFGLSKSGSGVHMVFLVSSMKLDLANHTVLLDVAVIPLTFEVFGDKKMKEFLGALSAAGFCGINITSEELRVWKMILPALVERCRTWSHKSTCEYRAKGEVPILEGLEDAQTPICACGVGKFPAEFLGKTKLPNLQYVLKKYATRAAISPIFCVPYVEDCFLNDVMPSKSENVVAGNSKDVSSAKPGTMASPAHVNDGGLGCHACGSSGKKKMNGEAETLMTCARCKKAKYCSTECQKAHWKTHKPAYGAA